MDLLSTLLRSGGFEALSRRSGMSASEVNDIAGVMIPEQFEAMRFFVRTHGGGAAGVDVLLAMLDGLGDGDMAADVLAHAPLSPDAGRELIRRLYPDPAIRDETMRRIAFESGQAAEAVNRLAPYSAMLVGGYLAARSDGSGQASADTKGLGPFYKALVESGSETE